MSLTEITSILVGVGGLGFGVYQYYSTRKSEERKQRLRDLSDDLNDVRSRIERAHDGFVSPLSNVDLEGSLEMISKSILAFKYETEETPRVKVAGTAEDGFISNKEQALEQYKEENEWVSVWLTIDAGDTDFDARMNYDINQHIFYLSSGYETLHEIRENYKDILEEFDPGLYTELESTLDKIVQEAHGEVIRNSGGVHFRPDDYESVDKISESVFERFWRYPGIEEDLEELSKLLERLEETRTSILQASYS